MPLYKKTACRIFCFLTWCVVVSRVQAELFPPTSLYPVYIADPLRTTFNAQYQWVSNSSLADTGDRRFDLKMGAELPVYATEFSGMPWEVSLIAGFHGLFDNTQSQDNIGWDGIYGIQLAGRLYEQLSLRFGTKHISAHIGDEYIERTGRTRINYTREELRLGLAWLPVQNTTLYTELGHAFDMRNTTLQQPWRVQVGAQYAAPLHIKAQPLAWYVALDVSSYEENDWQKNYTLQTGFTAPSGLHQWRLGLEYYDGRVQLGEFFQDSDRYWGIGLWFDL